MPPSVTAAQREVIEAALTAKYFLSGPPGAGKSTAGLARLNHLLDRGIAGNTILVLTPQRSLQEPYLASIRSPEMIAGGEVTTATIGGLARRVCELFWPLVAKEAGFSDPSRPPLFLTLETSQYYMARIVRPLFEDGYFDSVTIDRNRLYAQITDNLNKAATVGFKYTEIGARLDAAWFGEPGQRRIYADAQDCATRFRQFCLAHSVLDFSLQLEVFWTYLWPHAIVHDYLLSSYRHLIYDNVEEDVPRAHDLIREWISGLESALLIYDEGGGHRRFLGADVETAWSLRELCNKQASFDGSFVMSEAISRLHNSLVSSIAPEPSSKLLDRALSPAGNNAAPVEAVGFEIISRRFYPEVLDAVTAQVALLLSQATPPDTRLAPSEIVVLAPYLSDALRYALTSRLEARGIPWRTHRPSRSLRDEPASMALLTLAALAHPSWNIHPSKYDVAYALMLALDTDLVRAQLLAEIVYRTRDFALSSFDQINPEKQDRITFVLGGRYSRLRDWIVAYRELLPLPLDHFLRRLFGEVLSQPGFGLHENLDAARVASSLVESVRKFRLAMEPSFVNQDHADFDVGREYVAVLQEGIIAAQYLESWRPGPDDAVLVAPAHSFLMMNRPVEIQFWLDPGSSGWYQRLDQPLTHTLVLSREWPPDRKWTFADEDQANRETMARLVSGLLRRCSSRIYLGLSELGEAGFEQRGALLHAFQTILRERRLDEPR